MVLTPDELYLDLLSYSGDLIKLSSFTEYSDKLKASAAFVNRVLPPELSLNLSQKCLFLVEGKIIFLADFRLYSKEIRKIKTFEKFKMRLFGIKNDLKPESYCTFGSYFLNFSLCWEFMVSDSFFIVTNLL